MAQKYYNLAEVAQRLGKSVEEVRKMLERRELYAYRDGADWKFKVEDIDRIAPPPATPAAPPETEGGDVLLSEVELGRSDPSLSGTVIGLDGAAALVPESDIQLDAGDLPLVGEALEPKASKTPPKLSQSDALAAGGPQLSEKPKTSGSSIIDLLSSESGGELVLGGGSGSGSDVTLSSDSGISLLEPSDSGLSLETPINLGAVAEPQPAGAKAADSKGQLKPDDDFLLTPLEEPSELEESESGSQVIALDTELEEPAAAAPAAPAVASMLEEDLALQPATGLAPGGFGAPGLAVQPAALAEGAALQPSVVLLEPPYTVWQIVGLAFCALLLILCGMMMFDLLRNMWSWEGPLAFNSRIMDAILSLLGEAK